MERRNQYRRSEIRYRSKKARKTGSLDRSRSKERRESFISYSKEELLKQAKEEGKKCDHSHECDCVKVKQQLADTLTKKSEGRSRSETRSDTPEKSEEATNKGVEIKQYNAKFLPKRIANIKKNRAKTMKETSKFYMDLPADYNSNTELKIVEASDKVCEDKVPDVVDKNAETIDVVSLKKDAEIISQLILQNADFSRKPVKPALIRRKSFDQPERIMSDPKFTETHFDIDNPPKTSQSVVDVESKVNEEEAEPIYESLLRNVHVPYKFAPPMVRRPFRKAKENKLKLKIPKPEQDVEPDKDGSDCDYVTLTYTPEGDLSTVDGEVVPKTTKSNPSTPASSKNEILMLSCSDTNINYGKALSEANFTANSRTSSDELKDFISDTTSEILAMSNSTNDLERRGSLNTKIARSLYKRFMSHKSPTNATANNDETMSQKSISTSTSRKSLDGMSFNFKSLLSHDRKTSVPESPVYKQGSEDLGSRIAHVDYADPRTLFQSTSSISTSNTNIFINKNSLKSQRDSVFSSSSDSVCDKQQQSSVEFANNYYEQSVEDCLENDFRDSAIYSDDNNDRQRLDTLLASGTNTHQEHIYASVVKREKIVPTVEKLPATPPKIPKKPSCIAKPSFHTSPPPIPIKPLNLSHLKSPPILFKTVPSSSGASSIPKRQSPPSSPDSLSPKSWVLQQVQRFQ